LGLDHPEPNRGRTFKLGVGAHRKALRLAPAVHRQVIEERAGLAVEDTLEGGRQRAQAVKGAAPPGVREGSGNAFARERVMTVVARVELVHRHLVEERQLGLFEVTRLARKLP